jgi:hypothetical protein
VERSNNEDLRRLLLEVGAVGLGFQTDSVESTLGWVGKKNGHDKEFACVVFQGRRLYCVLPAFCNTATTYFGWTDSPTEVFKVKV